MAYALESSHRRDTECPEMEINKLSEQVVGAAMALVAGMVATVPSVYAGGTIKADDDKWISIAVKTEEEWKNFCKAIGNPEWSREARFADTFSRLNHLNELDRFITEWTSKYEPYEIMDILQKAGVAAVPVMNVEDQYFDPHFKARQTFIEVEHPLVGMEVLYGFPFKLSKTPAAIHRVCPSLGEHNNYVFGELLGLSDEEIKRLYDEGVLEK